MLHEATSSRSTESPKTLKPSRRSPAQSVNTILTDDTQKWIDYYADSNHSRSNVMAVTSADRAAMKPVMIVPASSTSNTSLVAEDDVDETLDVTERIQQAFPIRIPTLTEVQIRQALSIVPPDGPQFRCWLCRLQGHTMYTCPYLTSAQQRYCAYQNYLFKEKTELNRDQEYAVNSRVNSRLGTPLPRRKNHSSSRGQLRFSDTPYPKSPLQILPRSNRQSRQDPNVLAITSGTEPSTVPDNVENVSSSSDTSDDSKNE